MLRDVVHSKNFDDGAVVHRHPLFDSTRETNTTPRPNSSEKKTKRRRTSSSSSSSSPPSLPFSSLVSLSSSSLWCCLLSFDWKRLVYTQPQKKKKQKRGRFLWPQKKFILSQMSLEGESRKRPLSLSLPLSFSFSLSFSHLLVFLSSPSSIKCLSLSLFQSRFFVCALSFVPPSDESQESTKNKKKRESTRTYI